MLHEKEQVWEPPSEPFSKDEIQFGGMTSSRWRESASELKYDWQFLETKGWLNDVIIDSAMRLLQCQFPELEGLEPAI